MADTEGFNTDCFKKYKSDGCEVINLKLVKSVDEIEDDSKTFHPEMTHQIFGESETIFGYRDLSVDLFYTAGALHTLLQVNYEEKIDPAQAEGLEPDPVERLMARHMPPAYCTGLDAFSQLVAKDASFRPFGEKLVSYTRTIDGKERRFGIYQTSLSEPGFSEFHARLQVWLLYFVDAASFLDVDDDHWNFYLIFEEYGESGQSRFATAGYMTAYRYYAYPDLVRPRISQVLLLPPFQRQGHCVELLRTFYAQCRADTKVKDITVEDPSESFQRVRDFTDCLQCRELAAFQSSRLAAGFSDAQRQACRELKINKRQGRRVYEILRLASVQGDPEHPAYRRDVCKRLAAPFTRRARLQQVLTSEEISALSQLDSDQQREETVQRLYEELMPQYLAVVERLNKE